jgi:hypothetical protein
MLDEGKELSKRQRQREATHARRMAASKRRRRGTLTGFPSEKKHGRRLAAPLRRNQSLTTGPTPCRPRRQRYDP